MTIGELLKEYRLSQNKKQKEFPDLKLKCNTKC